MIQRFQAQCFQKNIPQRFVVAILSKRRPQVYFAVVAEARTDFSVGREPHFVAHFAKMKVRHGADKADERAGFFKQIVPGRPVAEPAVGLVNQFVVLGEQAHGLADWQEIFLGQNIRSRQGHQFNETQRQSVFRRKQYQRPQFLFIHATHEDAVQFHAPKSGGQCRANTREHGVQVPTGDPPVNFRIQRVETHIRRPQSGGM